ncbi:hypothetical protein RAA17_11225 [Komagataeibacter rhaeticus]|nr:hypothetical protein [Komagataeibacter rhaeticus]
MPDGSTVAIIRAYMAHHQGMSILAVADAVMNGIMRTRFHDDPVIASAELLLQERAPRTGAVARPCPPRRRPRPRTRHQRAIGTIMDHAETLSPSRISFPTGVTS